jgi:hypothetical protein
VLELVKHGVGLAGLARPHLLYIPVHRCHRILLPAGMLMRRLIHLVEYLAEGVFESVVRVNASICGDFLKLLQSMQLPLNCQGGIGVLRVDLLAVSSTVPHGSLEGECRMGVEGPGILQEVLPTGRVSRYLRKNVGGGAAHRTRFSRNSLILRVIIVYRVLLLVLVSLCTYTLSVTGETLCLGDLSEGRLTLVRLVMHIVPASR